MEEASLSGGCDVELGRWPYLFLSARRKLGSVKTASLAWHHLSSLFLQLLLLNLLYRTFSFLLVSYAYLEFLAILLTLFSNFSSTLKQNYIYFFKN